MYEMSIMCKRRQRREENPREFSHCMTGLFGWQALIGHVVQCVPPLAVANQIMNTPQLVNAVMKNRAAYITRVGFDGRPELIEHDAPCMPSFAM